MVPGSDPFGTYTIAHMMLAAIMYFGSYLIITSNHSIEEVFRNCQFEDVQAIKRRFHEVQMVPGSIIQWARVPKDQLIN